MMLTGVGSGGWVWCTVGAWDSSLGARVRFALNEAGRLEPVELHVEGDDVRLTGDMLRLVPLAHLESWANGPGRDELLDSLRSAGGVERRTQTWRKAVGGDTVRVGPARSIRRRSLRLTIPKSRRKPDAFYERVGELYLALVGDPNRARSRRPAQEIADANGVPVTTVHRWLREARHRDLLTTAPKGRAG